MCTWYARWLDTVVNLISNSTAESVAEKAAAEQDCIFLLLNQTNVQLPSTSDKAIHIS
jgi:hypothetical protein